MHRAVALGDHARQVGDKRRPRDADSDVLSPDGQHQPRHAVIRAEQAGQRGEAGQVARQLHPRAAHGEIGIEQVGERRDHRAQRQRGHAADHGQQRAAQRQPDNQRADAEELRGNRHLVLGVLQLAQIERVGKAAPDRVGDAVGQDQRDHQHRGPFQPSDDLGERQDQRAVAVIKRGIERGARWRIGGEHVTPLLAHRFEPARDQARDHHGGDHDQRAHLADELGRIRARFGHRGQGADHEIEHRHQRPAPQQRHRAQRIGAHPRGHLPGLPQRAEIGTLALQRGGAALGIGREQAKKADRQQDRAHAGEHRRPAHPLGHEQRQRAAHQCGDAVAHLEHGREDIDRRHLVRDIDAPGVDHHVLRGAGEGADPRQQREHPERGQRIERREHHQNAPQQQLRGDNPLFALAELAQARKVDPVQRGGPQELEGIGKAHQREHAHRLDIDLGIGQPRIERAEQQRIGQPAGKAEQQDITGLGMAQRRQQGEPARKARVMFESGFSH